MYGVHYICTADYTNVEGPDFRFGYHYGSEQFRGFNFWLGEYEHTPQPQINEEPVVLSKDHFNYREIPGHGLVHVDAIASMIQLHTERCSQLRVAVEQRRDHFGRGSSFIRIYGEILNKLDIIRAQLDK